MHKSSQKEKDLRQPNNYNRKICIVECPRDAMQGWKTWIPTTIKRTYIEKLLQVGFPILDMGSFVSPRAVPQMRDTADLINQINYDPHTHPTRLLVIVANEKYAREAAHYDAITYLGFSFSVSETFMWRNLRMTRKEGLRQIEKLLQICHSHNKQLVVYLSMAFGNPYGEPWQPDEIIHWGRQIYELGATIHVLADTTAQATPQRILQLCTQYTRELPDIHWGIHLHTTPSNWKDHLEAAWQAGCLRYDSALGGYGGCPFAQDDHLVSNLPTEALLSFLNEKGVSLNLNWKALEEARRYLPTVFQTNPTQP